VPVVNRAIHFYVPINDRLTWRYDMGYLDRPVKPEDVYRTNHIDADYRKLENMSNGYKQDREKMRTGNFSGIDAVFVQDACVTETMDYSGVFDRTHERLGMSDMGIITVRDYLVRAAEAHSDGAEPPHIIMDPADNDMSHIDTVADVFPVTESWREHWPHLK
jgi:phthalate 4,5-dioxygenase oxygenase subunit